MNMKYVNVLECRTGDMLAKDIVNASGVKLVSQNTMINPYIKDRIAEWGVRGTWVYTGNGSDTAIHTETRNKVYTSITSAKKILIDLISGKELDYTALNNASNTLLCTLDDSGFVIKCLEEIKNTDEYTYTHCINVAFYSMLIAKWLGADDNQITGAIQSGLLHDIGKIRVPDEILNKNCRLTEEEFSSIKRHAQYGYDIVKNTNELDNEIKTAVLMHHERMDGSGYPYGVKNNSLNLYTKIVSIADVYDAMTTDRVYKKRVTPFEVFDMFMTEGSGMFDVSLLKLFISNLAPYYVGAKVMLDNGRIGEVACIPPNDVSNPIINIDSEYLSLSHTDNKILSIL